MLPPPWNAHLILSIGNFQRSLKSGRGEKREGRQNGGGEKEGRGKDITFVRTLSPKTLFARAWPTNIPPLLLPQCPNQLSPTHLVYWLKNFPIHRAAHGIVSEIFVVGLLFRSLIYWVILYLCAKGCGLGLCAIAISALLLHFFCQRFLSSCISVSRQKLYSWVHSHFGCIQYKSVCVVIDIFSFDSFSFSFLWTPFM